MNDVLKSIESRRSTRGFLPEQIFKEDLDKIIKSGFQAPSGMNLQDWHFVAIQNNELITELNDCVKTMLPEELQQRMLGRFNGDENYSVFYNAPTLVMTFAKDGNESAPLDCSFASQNMVLSAQSLGYNSCYIGMARILFANESFYKKLNVPEGYKIVTIIALGKGSVEMPFVDRDFNKITYFL